ncbi:MAG: electron transport complex subunit E [Lachnospiraceae bacterium]|nr:electron transport complex subunit E [Ruminococcus sp.]MCM1274349.1 electron transport complex subunit E [Lachnospiraceae bacterium]
MSYLKEFTKGLIKENPTLVTLLGMCPTLAITTMASNAIGMGAAATFVLICSNVAISLLKKVIPKQVRLPSYIVIIAGFVTLVGLILQAFVPAVYDALGIYLPLITVNCIILGRAEMFASKNNVAASALDGAGMGVGFTLALLVMGSVREILGSGTWFGLEIYPDFVQPMTIFVLPAGGFFVLGCVIALVNKIANRKPPEATGCAACPNRESCISVEKGAETAEKTEKEENK